MSRRHEAIAGLLARPPLPLLGAVAARHSGSVLLAGGALRDALLGRRPADLDIAVGGDLEAFIERWREAGGPRPVAIGDDWRDTRRARVDGMQLDIGSLLGDPVADLAQRDFTMNAMAVALGSGADDEIIDPHGGAEDVAAGAIRMVSAGGLDADPLRLLRAVRYFAALPGFALEADTRAAIGARAAAIDGVAAERVQGEWQLLIGAPRWLEAAELAYALGLGQRTLAETADLGGAAAWNAFEADRGGADIADRESIRLASLLVAAPESSACEGDLRGRRWPSAQVRRVCRARRWSVAATAADDATLVGWAMEDRAAASQAALLADALAADDAAARAAAGRLQTYAERAAETPWVGGKDLIGWGMPEGPAMGELLDEAVRGQLQRRWPSRHAALAWAQERVVAAAGARS